MRTTRMLAVLASIAVVGNCSDSTSSNIPEGLEVFTATLNGTNERPTAVTTTATGHAIVTILSDSLISWEVVIDSPIDSITVGHIHRFNSDTGFGGVVVNLAPPATGLDFIGTAAVGSATPVDSVFDIIRAGRAYVNIHTRVNGGGEIRGNLVKQ
ncbi:MAG TPA: CHRD domain-containing protein [Gemmatimonadales bacterium]|nr:CHRD domain-containing protein [Gemmatimonadales bacterium]